MSEPGRLDVSASAQTGAAGVTSAGVPHAPASASARTEALGSGARGLVVNGGALVVNVLAAGLTGLGFWVLAARVASPETVGEASTAISAIIAVVGVAQQSLVRTLPPLLAMAPDPRGITVRMYRVGLALTLVLAPAYVVIGPMVADGLGFLRGWGVGSGFVVAALIWSTFSLQDAVLTGVRKSPYVLVENAAWGLSRLGLLVVAYAGGVRLDLGTLLASWMVPALICVVVVSGYLFWSDRSPLLEPRGARVFPRRRFLSYLGAEYASSVLGSVLALVTTAYGVTVMGAGTVAPLLIALSLVVVVEGALAAFSQALAVEASREDDVGEARSGLVRLTVLALGGISLAAVVGGLALGEEVMGLLGSHYRESGGAALAVLMLSVPARAVALVSNADNRLRGEGGRNLLQQVVSCAVCFALLATRRFDTVTELAWVMVVMRYATVVVAVAHLARGRLRLHV